MDCANHSHLGMVAMQKASCVHTLGKLIAIVAVTNELPFNVHDAYNGH